MAILGDAIDVDAFTEGSKGACKGSGKKQDSEVLCVVIARRRIIELPNVARSRRTTTVESRKVPREHRDEQQEIVQRQMLQKCQDWSHVDGVQIKGNECIRSWRRVGRDGMHRNGKYRIECIGDRSSAVARRRSQKWDRFWPLFRTCEAGSFFLASFSQSI